MYKFAIPPSLSTQQNARRAMNSILLFIALFQTSHEALSIPCVAPAPTVMAAGSGTDLAGFCSYLASTATALSSAATEVSAAKSAANSELSLSEQIIQNAKLAEIYAQQALAAQNLIIQTEMMIRDLQENPLNVVVPDAALLLSNQQRINKLAADIANNSGTLGDNLAKNLTNPKTSQLGQGSTLELWSDVRIAAIKETFEQHKNLINSMQRKNKNVEDAVRNGKTAEGPTAAAKAASNTLAEILLMLQRMEAALQQQTSLAATDAAILHERQIDAQRQLKELAINRRPGSSVQIAPDGYDGPGKSSNRAF